MLFSSCPFSKIAFAACGPQILGNCLAAGREWNLVIDMKLDTHGGGWTAATHNATKPVPFQNLVAQP